MDTETYIAAAAPEVQPLLRELRRRVAEALPDAVETVSYGMPALKQRRVFFYYAAFKKHLGVYPPLAEGHPLRAELAPYANAKGNLAFPLKDRVPIELIVRVAVALADRYR